MDIQIWLDFSCPFCYIGKRNLDHALARLENSENIHIIYRSYELIPQFIARAGQSIFEQLAEKYAVSVERALMMTDNASEIAKESGITMNFDQVIPANTFKAHQLMHFAQELSADKGAAIVEALLHAYFVTGTNLDDEDILVQIAESIGMERMQAESALSNNTYATSVRADEVYAHSLPVNSVPFFIFNNELVVTGAQSAENFWQLVSEISH